jgi:hypothetical protein
LLFGFILTFKVFSLVKIHFIDLQKVTE